MKTLGKIALAVGALGTAAYANADKLAERLDKKFPPQTEKATEATSQEIVEITQVNPKAEKPDTFVIKDPKTGKVLASEKLGDGDTTQAAVKKLLKTYENAKTSPSANFKKLISRLNEKNNLFPTAQKLKDNDVFSMIAVSLQNAYALVRNMEKKEIQKIADAYNKIYGLNIVLEKPEPEAVAKNPKPKKITKPTNPLANFDYKAQGLTKEEWESISQEEKEAFARSVGYDVSAAAKNLVKNSKAIQKQEAEIDSLQRIVDRNKGN